MLAAVDEAVNPAQVVPTRRSKPKAAAEAVNQTAQVALMKKKTKTPRKRPGKVVEPDSVCAVRTTQLNEKRPMVQRPSAFL
jgi:hypothetical protein